MYIIHLPLQYSIFRSQVEVGPLPKEYEWADEVPHRKEVDAVRAGHEHDGERHPQHAQEHQPLVHV